ncbi:uncharacterized protein [Haliotis cracherodii]|uniref:uncharacterized protein n=1 Tax=Haliotis cracherodii TaxID=6455 RepID=UPI0039EC8EDA
MASSVSEAKEEDTDIFILVPKTKVKRAPDPQYNSTKHVKESRNITFACSINWEKDVDVLWLRRNDNQYNAYVRYHKGVCTGSANETLVNLHVGNGSCFNNSYELKITNISKQYEGEWYCVVNQEWYSQYIDLRVDMHYGVTTSQVTRAPTTSMVKVKVSRHDALTSKSTKATTGYSTERTDKEQASINTLVPLIGGAAGGAFVLLALVITGCVLYRSKREVNKSNDGPASTDHDRDPGAHVEEAVAMEGDVIYRSCGAGNDDYAQIPCREPASASHEKEDASALKNQPDTEDRNTNQPGVDSGDIYAVPDKPKKSTVEDVEDVYSQVQKPKTGIE